MPILDNTNSALTEQIWQQFQAQNPGATWSDFRAAFPINAQVTQQSGPNGMSWVPATQPSLPAGAGMLTDVQNARKDDGWYAGNYANYLQAQNGAQAGFNTALQNALDPKDWEALQMVQLGNHSWFPGGGAITYGMSSIDPRQYLVDKFGTFDTNQIAQALGVPLMPTLDQGGQQAKPYNDYLASLNTLRSQIPVQTPSFPTASPISGGTTMLNPQAPSTITDPGVRNQLKPITYPTVGDSSAWMAQPTAMTDTQQRLSANGMLYS